MARTARGPAWALLLPLIAAANACARVPEPILDKPQQLARFDWWDNHDTDWFAANVPFLETPDAEIDATYYYRWELVTKHLVFGSPEVGYTFTEFIDRPFWSGAYGGISCPLGHQMYEVRWLHDRRIVEDFARSWLTAPEAEPRSYSNWYGDAVWATYRVLGDPRFAASMLPLMEAQYAGWLAERWGPEHRMFRWDGMHDGMETNIGSRQTPQWFDGAEGYRPTLNSYLYADAVAISKAAALAGEQDKSRAYAERARELKERVQRELWDPERRFFFPQFAAREATVADPWPGAGDGGDEAAAAGASIVDARPTPPIEPLSLTYQTGPWAGDPHGRELIGFVPWQFGLPDSGYEDAWRTLFDPEVFWSEHGPTTTEQGDPLFYVSPRCCVWSGNSWPYATTQTLVALANLLNDYEQDVVDAADYFRLLQAYTRTQRKDGRPYVAEAADPFTGSWAGHDTWFHSEHYFHSGYVDLVITGLIGLRPRDDDRLVVNPLVPADWDWFALDDVAYRGHRVSVIWDRDGSRYGRGAGLQVLVDGDVLAAAPEIGRLAAELPPAAPPPAPARRHNVAVHNDATWFPAASASSSLPHAPPAWAVDGQHWYHTSPPNRWLPTGENARDWFEVDFGVARRIDTVTLYFLDDDAQRVDPVAERAPEALVPLLLGGSTAAPPASYRLLMPDGSEWVEIPGQVRDPEEPAGRRANAVRFPAVSTEVIRVELEHRPGTVAGLSELEAWSDEPLPLAPPLREPANLAFNATGEGYPRVSASSTGAGGAPVRAVNDGRIAFNLYTDGAWRAADAERASDSIEIDLGRDRTVDRIDLYLWAWPGRGTEAPAAYRIEALLQGAWRPVVERARAPATPLALARNRLELEPITTSRVRVVLEHAATGAAAVSELAVFGR